jgi:hypothetical protein
MLLHGRHSIGEIVFELGATLPVDLLEAWRVWRDGNIRIRQDVINFVSDATE